MIDLAPPPDSAPDPVPAAPLRAAPVARLPGLDALRAIAAVCVVVMHVGPIYRTPEVLDSAYLAVDFFFLLSGFVMARTYEQRMRSGRIGAWRFLWLRYLRLWPTMAVGALLSLPFLWRDGMSWSIAANVGLPNFFLLPTRSAPVIFALNLPAWSVFFELLANFAHGLLVQRLSNRTLALLVACLLAALGLCAWQFGNLDLGSRPENVVGGLARVAFSYALGILLWRFHGDRAPFAVPPVLAFLAMPVLFAAAQGFGFEGPIFDVAFVAVAGPLMLWGGLRSRAMESLARRVGALSFPLYAVHFPVLLAAEAAGISRHLAPFLALACALVTQAGVRRLEHRLKATVTF